MASLQIPIAWDIDEYTLLSHGKGKLAIHAKEGMAIEGSIQDAAIALVKYSEQELAGGALLVFLNRTLTIELDGKGIKFDYAGSKPKFWDALMVECNRIMKMRAFW